MTRQIRKNSHRKIEIGNNGDTLQKSDCRPAGFVRVKKRRIQIVLLCASAIAVVAGYLAIQKPAEPSYDGRTLSSWLRWFGTGNTYTEDMISDRIKAIRRMGTNTIPYILADLRAKDSSGKKWFISELAKYDGKIWWNHDWLRNERAMGAWEALNPDPKLAAPILSNLLKDDITADVRNFASEELKRIESAKPANIQIKEKNE